MRFLILLSLVGCAAQPNLETGDGCWRYGVLESGNTGKMSKTPVMAVPVVSLGYDALQRACGAEVRACYAPVMDTIFVYEPDLGDYYINHERCHVILGPKHNHCQGYGIGRDESACEL